MEGGWDHDHPGQGGNVPNSRLRLALLLLCIMFLVACIALAATLKPAHGHDEHGRPSVHANWIERGGYQNAAGHACCGRNDCVEIPRDYVTRRDDGYFVMVDQVNELVPWKEVQPSPDGTFWRCKYPDGSRRCFFGPKDQPST